MSVYGDDVKDVGLNCLIGSTGKFFQGTYVGTADNGAVVIYQCDLASLSINGAVSFGCRPIVVQNCRELQVINILDQAVDLILGGCPACAEAHNGSVFRVSLKLKNVLIGELFFLLVI